jgi:transposase
MTRPIGTSAELERRRRQAVARVQAGERPSVVARVLGVNRNSLYRWRQQAEHAPKGLAATPHPGPTPRLSDGQLAELEGLLAQGAKHHGWPNDLWTAARAAKLIARHFGEAFHPDHVRRFLRARLGWTSQKPRKKARERDDEEVQRWLDQEFPRIVRQTRRRGAYLVFLDESGFQLTPSVRRTLAKRGQTPVLACWDRRDRIAAISSISISPRRQRLGLQFELLPDNDTVRAADVVAYLRKLRAELGPLLTVVWDGNGIHDRSRLVQAFLAKHPGVVTEKFPGYVPELNPDEGVWGWTKYGRLANLAAWSTDHLRDHLIGELVVLKHSPDLLASFIEQTGLPLKV